MESGVKYALGTLGCLYCYFSLVHEAVRRQNSIGERRGYHRHSMAWQGWIYYWIYCPSIASHRLVFSSYHSNRELGADSYTQPRCRSQLNCKSYVQRKLFHSSLTISHLAYTHRATNLQLDNHIQQWRRKSPQS